MNSPIMTVQQHILQEQRRHFPGASGEFSWLLSGITLATKMIAAQVRRAGLMEITGEAGSSPLPVGEGTGMRAADAGNASLTPSPSPPGRGVQVNVQGEIVQKLDVIANHALIQCLGNRGNVAVMASEENESPVVVERDWQHGKYVVVFDPLDGSSNIDVNVSVGTIFSILRREPNPDKNRTPLQDVLQPGTRQVAAGYVVYGSSTMFVYTAGNGVSGFTLDPSIGAYLISHPNITMPANGSIYSCNEANADSFPEPYRRYLAHLRSGKAGRAYSSRYIGSLVADFHRTLLKGGIFLYPPTASHPKGKLRLLYEGNPIAFLAEQAQGRATDGRQRIMEKQPRDLHERTPLLVGSREEMSILEGFLEATE
ncbi:MAG: class 1 fructose-bisphosphatase [Planctomycetes bacterium]|nr:class 1 fructose-bisphosphatase [Planctomycetota bacterium]